jgi:hypothetical protein
MNWDFLSLLNILSSKEKSIELKQLSFVNPVFILWLLALRDSWKIEVMSIKKGENDVWVYNYLNRVWFFDHIGQKCKEIKKNEVDSLIEITLVNNDLNELTITNLVKKILKNMWFKMNKENQKVYHWFLWLIVELIWNIKNHAQLSTWKGAYIMMQCYKKSWDLNFTIVDAWIWIKNSYRNSVLWKDNKTDRDYIETAFTRWKTSNPLEWAWNGLSKSKELIKLTGWSMQYFSWNCLYYITWNDERYITDEKKLWEWVLIDIHINLNNIKSSDILW